MTQWDQLLTSFLNELIDIADKRVSEIESPPKRLQESKKKRNLQSSVNNEKAKQ